MLRKNLMSAIVAATATAAILTGYNAFLRNGVSEGNRATAKLSSYLNLDKSKQESKTDENNVAGTDNGATTAQPDVAVTETPSADSAQSSTASPSDSAAKTEDTKSTSTATAPAVAKAESTYTVKDGDTYGCIAEKYYGSFEHYTDVMTANPVANEGFSEYELHVGAKLTLPAVTKENLKPASSLCQ